MQGNHQRVEEIVLGILGEIQNLARIDASLSAATEVQRLETAIAALSAAGSSIPDGKTEKVAYSYTHYGSGSQNVNSGAGNQNMNSGSGEMYVGSTQTFHRGERSRRP